MAVSDSDFKALELKVDNLTKELSNLEADLSKYQTSATAKATASDQKTTTDALATRVSDLEAKMVTIKLPSETQWYLKEKDIKGLMSIVNQAKALKDYVNNALKGVLATVTKMERDRNS